MPEERTPESDICLGGKKKRKEPAEFKISSLTVLYVRLNFMHHNTVVLAD